ncbi:MAG: sigma-70 family RNA polymerase sigma factor [bacterium]|nr:sigma-70 family RNA polymerase sigma factor [bacterium]
MTFDSSSFIMIPDPNETKGNPMETADLQQVASKYHGLITGICAKALLPFGRRQDLDDCVQATYLKLAEGALAKYDPSRGASLGTWCGMVAYQTTMDHLRGSRHRRTVASDDQTDAMVDESDSPEQALASAVDSERLRRAMTALTEYEQCLLSWMLQGERNKEIAQTLGISQIDVGNAKHRALGKLRRAMQV